MQKSKNKPHTRHLLFFFFHDSTHSKRKRGATAQHDGAKNRQQQGSNLRARSHLISSQTP